MVIQTTHSTRSFPHQPTAQQKWPLMVQRKGHPLATLRLTNQQQLSHRRSLLREVYHRQKNSSLPIPLLAPMNFDHCSIETRHCRLSPTRLTLSQCSCQKIWEHSLRNIRKRSRAWSCPGGYVMPLSSTPTALLTRKACAPTGLFNAG